MARAYYDCHGTHVLAGHVDEVCGFCKHTLNNHYFLNNNQFAHCDAGGYKFMGANCKCESLKNDNWVEKKPKLKNVRYSVKI